MVLQGCLAIYSDLKLNNNQIHLAKQPSQNRMILNQKIVMMKMKIEMIKMNQMKMMKTKKLAINSLLYIEVQRKSETTINYTNRKTSDLVNAHK